MVKGYNVPNAGDYNAPTPHAAQVAQDPYTAPSSGQGGVASSGSAGAGIDAMENAPSWSPTPGEAAEAPERYDET